MDISKYRDCDICGERYKDEYSPAVKPELCTTCWYIPEHIPESQHDRIYKVRYEKHKHKKMLLLRKTDS
jgi:hypothetical protein